METDLRACRCCSDKGVADQPSTNAPNPWKTMVDTVRDADLRKVADAKEDLDTLLVFAGLFSAVVTTFVVDSYASLQPDNTGELVFLMRQSLSQYYTFADGVLRPAVPFPSDTAFEAPLWALRVNGLWFASLIVSLSTASFGMLVKQWLNEYVAMDWITPEEQLRARQFRHRGLEDWKVYEIAAMLPLLLHVSLGLFFVGLCFYTAAANDLIGRSTFPLVAGWAFFALLSIIAPLASPRCPYKIAIFKSALRVGRRYATPAVRSLGSALWVVCCGVVTPIQDGINCLGRLLASLYWYWDRSIENAVNSIWNSDSWSQLSSCCYTCFLVCLPHILIGTLLVMAVVLPVISLFLVTAVLGCLFWICYTVLVKLKRLADLADQEEVDIMRQPYAADELLLSIDKVIVNDGPVLETMAAVLRQARAPPASAGAFVLGCIRHRIGAASGRQWMPSVDGRIWSRLDSRMLSDNAWNILMGLAADVLQPTIAAAADSARTQPGVHSIHLANCAVLLLSSSAGRPLPEPAKSWAHEAATRIKMLELSIDVLVFWSPGDILNILWTSFACVEHIPQPNAHHRVWDHIPQLDNHTPTDLQEITCRILLGRAPDIWNSIGEIVSEANLMLLYILGAAPPDLLTADAGRSLSDNSYHKGRQVYQIGHILDQLPQGDIQIALPLASILAKHPSLTSRALKLYSIFVTGSLLECTPLWELIREYNIDKMRSPAVQRILRDAWQLLLQCAESTTPDSSAHLQDRDFINLCLVLVQPTLLRSLGRSDPVSDWTTLVPVLTRIVDDGTLLKEDQTLFRRRSRRAMSEQERSTPFLAALALGRLPPNDAEFPPLLRDILAQLAAHVPRHLRLREGAGSLAPGTVLDRRVEAAHPSAAVLEEGLASPMALASEAAPPISLQPLAGAMMNTNGNEPGSRVREMHVIDRSRPHPVPPRSGASIEARSDSGKDVAPALTPVNALMSGEGAAPLGDEVQDRDTADAALEEWSGAEDHPQDSSTGDKT
ncbi:hypothetical protein PsYK624_115390 [Phanerochaete sordida]|uniref:DUF6535 domain-containing protein n=1 Tax=Phanerochaete sordida TaxID=48140 RepID=A0A9P3GKS9_9APHY|nr:hypothetical protein PsYK624_115390 [Phanerochaete sordida]